MLDSRLLNQSFTYEEAQWMHTPRNMVRRKIRLITLESFRMQDLGVYSKRETPKKAKACIFLGYLEHTKEYCLYDEKEEKIFRSRDVIFYEDAARKTNYWLTSQDNSESNKENADSVRDSEDDSEESYSMPNEDIDEEVVELSDDEQRPRRSCRVPKPKN